MKSIDIWADWEEGCGATENGTGGRSEAWGRATGIGPARANAGSRRSEGVTESGVGSRAKSAWNPGDAFRGSSGPLL